MHVCMYICTIILSYKSDATEILFNYNLVLHFILVLILIFNLINKFLIVILIAFYLFCFILITVTKL